MKTSKCIAYIGLLTALSVVLSSLEQFVPLQAIIPLPGIKLGIANVVTLLAIELLNGQSAFGILVLRCILAALLFGSPVSFAMSVTGGIFALGGMLFLMRFPKVFSWIGISIAGAALHNTGQVLCACIIMKSRYLVAYLPVLLLASILTGTLIGCIAKMTLRIKKTH